MSVVLVRGLSTQLFVIRNLVKIVDTKVAICYYFSGFQSKLLYGLSLWGSCSMVESILILQKKALRIIDNKPRNYPCRELFKKLGVMTVVNLFVFEVLSFSLRHGYLSAQGMAPAHGYNTRHIFHRQVQTPQSQKKGQSSRQTALQLFNKLPADLKKILKEDGPRKFKSVLKQVLTACPRYSIKEFVDNPPNV